MPRQLAPSDVFCDDLPEDGEIRDEQLVAAFDLLNEMIRQSEPLSWGKGKFAANAARLDLLQYFGTDQCRPRHRQPNRMRLAEPGLY